MDKGTLKRYGWDHRWGIHRFYGSGSRDSWFQKLDDLNIIIPELYYNDIETRFTVFNNNKIVKSVHHQIFNRWLMCKEYCHGEKICEGCPFTKKYKLVGACVDWLRNIDSKFNHEWLHIDKRNRHRDKIEIFWEKAKEYIRIKEYECNNLQFYEK